ncbi:MAG: DNA-3-methyladenine glycosylase [Methylotenera sp.]|uniref:DNA-3-methyladenine glycosylase family protein n=1 Tax=Methylotenera sp. TaxID=2051956 RepID=UPI002727DE15|nr:DNA-3-methyladenine glycosylase [Methylotenera sp.]MDO9392982.1 DNA-3-methyladenine glycosylase [Methylotenera sp.]MDP1523256.1 DNA-3-methyladenine glycosylase [Methylotenera sp.]
MIPKNYDLIKATSYLTRVDADWAWLINTVGPCTFELRPEREPYEALIRAVAYQQLHAKAGDAILGKFIKLFSEIDTGQASATQFPSPEQVMAAKFNDLRACGFSGRKIETLKNIAEGTLSGLVPSRSDAEAMTDEDLIQRLVALKGIGRWTVEMLLIFTLGRPDILPGDDFGIAEGYKRLKKLDIAPKRKEITEIGKAWSPYRTVASWYLWRVPK